jgi:small-conductance mechanosensitive channel
MLPLMPIAQVTVGSSPLMNLLALFHLALGIYFLVISIKILIRNNGQHSSRAIVLYVLQALIMPICLGLAAVILFFQGWRLDPILQLSVYLLTFAMIYLGAKDYILSRR